jgi:hypothetical protein
MNSNAVPSGLWIGLGLFLAFMLILIEVQLYSAARLLGAISRNLDSIDQRTQEIGESVSSIAINIATRK